MEVNKAQHMTRTDLRCNRRLKCPSFWSGSSWLVRPCAPVVLGGADRHLTVGQARDHLDFAHSGAEALVLTGDEVLGFLAVQLCACAHLVGGIHRTVVAVLQVDCPQSSSSSP